MEFIAGIKQVLHLARQNAYRAVNSAMIEAYWEIGRRLPTEEELIEEIEKEKLKFKLNNTELQ